MIEKLHIHLDKMESKNIGLDCESCMTQEHLYSNMSLHLKTEFWKEVTLQSVNYNNTSLSSLPSS